MSRPERVSFLVCAGLVLAIASHGHSQGGDAALSAVRESDRADRAQKPPSAPAAPAFTCSIARSPKHAPTGKR